MAEHERSAVSRRALIAGAGGVAGAVALGGVVPSAAAAPEAIGRGETSLGLGAAPGSGLPPLSVGLGVHYTTYSQYAFHPSFSAVGRKVSPAGAFTDTADGVLFAPVELEAGVQVVELAAGVCNSSLGFAFVDLSYRPLGSGPETVVGFVGTPPGGVGVVQLNEIAVSHEVSPENVYSLGIFSTSSGSVRVFSARIGYIPRGFGFTPVTPTRVYDSRPGNPPLGVTKGQLSNGTRVIDMLNGVWLPVTPKGVLTTTTVVNTSPTGFLSLYQNGIAWPGTSSVNWFTAGQIAATTAYTDVDSAGKAVAKVPASSSTDFFVDLVGYYA
jgi:hypothetical protein